MTNDTMQDQVVQQYLRAVSKYLTHLSEPHRQGVLRELAGHIHEAVRERTQGRQVELGDVYAVMAELDPPERYAAEASGAPGTSAPLPRRLRGLSVLCSLLQIVGLAAVVMGMPVVPAVAGFAAVVNFFFPRDQERKYQKVLRIMAAVCGLGLIIAEVSRAI